MLVVAGLAWAAIRWKNAAVRAVEEPDRPPRELSDCPETPNCVCSSASQESRRVAPLALRDSPPVAKARLEAILLQLPRSRVVVSQERYLRAEFRSFIFGFVDDVELLIEPEQQCVHIRSASRVGYSDLGVNRRRVEEIRRRYARRH